MLTTAPPPLRTRPGAGWLDIAVSTDAEWAALHQDHAAARATGVFVETAVHPLTRYELDAPVDDPDLRQYLSLPDAFRLAFRRDGRLEPVAARLTAAVTGFGHGLFGIGASLPESLVLLRSGPLHALVEPRAGVVMRVGESAARAIEAASADPRSAAVHDARAYAAFALRHHARATDRTPRLGRGGEHT